MIDFRKRRQLMVERQLKSRDITDQNVLQAMGQVPREKFVPENQKGNAYEDCALPISGNQTISQPYVVALMCQLLELTGKEKVLDIGTGSGYQAVVLSHLAEEVISIEVIPELAEPAKQTLKELNYNNVKIITGDGRKGAPEYAPFDGIKSAAASQKIPPAWKEQLKVGGHIVLPLKDVLYQKLVRLTKTKQGFEKESFGGVAFVPLINPR